MIKFAFALLASFAIISCQPRFEKEITTEEIEKHIAYLASDDLRGRYPGTLEDQLLSEYISSEFKQAGLKLHKKRGLQLFEIVTDIEAGPANQVAFGDTELVPDTDFRPFSFSASGSVSSEVLFAGYGFQIDDADNQWDDYAALDVKDKLVVLLRGVPGAQDGSSPYVNYSEDRGKALMASDQGAAGVLFVSGSSFDADDHLVELKGKQHPLSIPVIHMSRTAIDQLLTSIEADSLSIYESKIATQLQPVSFATGLTVNITVDLQPKKMESENVIAMLKGSDASLRSQYVILGAHHDHLGMGGKGTSSRQPDTVAVHYGADDNASGVAAVMEIAEQMVVRSPSRSILFTTFGAEEMGLVGSRYFAENPPIDLSMVQTMINIDMVGRLNEERQLQIGGIGTSPDFEHLLDSLNKPYGFSLKFSKEGFGPSDHASFYAKDVPVIFISTGAHPDYHTPADNLSRINLEGTREILMYVADIAEALANTKERIAFTEAGPKVSGSSRGRRGGITLGIMPDMTYDGTRGLPVMFATEGKPAAIGGIQKGDTIVAIEGKNVGNIYDYMSRLAPLKEGMSIIVTVKRDEDRLELVIRL